MGEGGGIGCAGGAQGAGGCGGEGSDFAKEVGEFGGELVPGQVAGDFLQVMDSLFGFGVVGKEAGEVGGELVGAPGAGEFGAVC